MVTCWSKGRGRGKEEEGRPPGEQFGGGLLCPDERTLSLTSSSEQTWGSQNQDAAHAEWPNHLLLLSSLWFLFPLFLSVAMNFLGSWVLCALFLPLSAPSAQLLKCHEVRSSFQLLYPGTKWAPETPVSGKPVILGEKEIVGLLANCI